MLELLEEKGTLPWFGRSVMDKLHIMHVSWNHCNFSQVSRKQLYEKINIYLGGVKIAKIILTFKIGISSPTGDSVLGLKMDAATFSGNKGKLVSMLFHTGKPDRE